MDLAATRGPIDALSVDERLDLVQYIWHGIAEQDLPHLTDAETAELDRRLAAYGATPDDAIPREPVKRRSEAQWRG